MSDWIGYLDKLEEKLRIRLIDENHDFQLKEEDAKNLKLDKVNCCDLIRHIHWGINLSDDALLMYMGPFFYYNSEKLDSLSLKLCFYPVAPSCCDSCFIDIPDSITNLCNPEDLTKFLKNKEGVIDICNEIYFSKVDDYLYFKYRDDNLCDIKFDYEQSKDFSISDDVWDFYTHLCVWKDIKGETLLNKYEHYIKIVMKGSKGAT